MSHPDPIPCKHCRGAALYSPPLQGVNGWVCSTQHCTNKTVFSSIEDWNNQPAPPRIAELEGEVEKLRNAIFHEYGVGAMGYEKCEFEPELCEFCKETKPLYALMSYVDVPEAIHYACKDCIIDRAIASFRNQPKVDEGGDA